MKLHADRIEGVNVINALTPQAIAVNGVPYRGGILVPWQGAVSSWGGGNVESLTADDFARIADLKPEVVIFGSGTRLRFPAPALLRTLIERRIGVETMDTAAACRTYNILAGEGRSVAAALLFAPETDGPSRT